MGLNINREVCSPDELVDRFGTQLKGEPLKCEPKGGWRVVGGLGGQSIRYWDQSGRMVYEVDVLRCREPSDVIDWLYHLSEKLWMTEELMGGFVGCLVEIGAVCPYPR